MNQTKTLF